MAAPGQLSKHYKISRKTIPERPEIFLRVKQLCKNYSAPQLYCGGREGGGKSAMFRIIPDHPNRPTPHNTPDRTSKPAQRR
jgi:hypothetical protein